jgi:LmbE family N-acetylglucosaminyl deacetylase
MTASNNRITLFLFAHQDDECAAAPWIEQEIAAGNCVACIFLTNGDGGGATPATRNRESAAVLQALGVKQTHIRFIGTDLSIRDGHLCDKVALASDAMEDWLRKTDGTISAVYAPDWEGGHPDHDATHLIAAALARRLNVLDASWGFSLYNTYKCPPPFFRALAPLPDGEHQTIRYGLWRGLSLSLLCWRYPSQRRTWLGLFPGFFFRRIVLRSERARRIEISRLGERPHTGQLLYERMFGTSASRLLEASSEIIGLPATAE